MPRIANASSASHPSSPGPGSPFRGWLAARGTRTAAAHTATTLLAITLAVAGCTREAAAPPPSPRVLRIQSGDQQSGAVGSALTTPLVVRVTDDDGTPVPGVTVQWDAAAGAGSIAPASGRTDAQGLAQTTWTLGTVVGSQRVSAQVGALSPVAFTATALPGPPALVVATPGAANLGVGDTLRIRAAVRDQYGNDVVGQAITFQSPDAAVSVRADGLVTAISVGQARVFVTAGTRADTVAVTVFPAGASACGAIPVRLPAVGEVIIPDPASTGATACLGAAATTAAEYGLVTISTAASFGTAVAMDLFAQGIGAPTVAAVTDRFGGLFQGAAQPRSDDFVLPQAAADPLPPLDWRAEYDRRVRERRELAPLVEAARAEMRARLATREGVAAAVQPKVARIGDLLTLNAQANSACTNPDNRVGRVVAVGSRAIIVADTANPSGGYTDAEYQGIAATFDTLVYPLDSAAFGIPTDVSGYGKVILFYTRAVNALTPQGAQFVIGGFFFARDLYPRTARNNLPGCTSSNEAEMFYLLVPDPAGTINGNARAKDAVTRLNLGTVTHEFQHLINSSRRLYVNAGAAPAEEIWLDEGLSHVAEELLFLRVAGFTSRQNLTLGDITGNATRLANFNEFASQNFSRLFRFLQNPEANAPYAPNDSLATRGAIWHFLRYVAGRQAPEGEAPFFRALVNSTTVGLANLSARVPGWPLDLYLRDWAVATLADDFSTEVNGQLSTDYRIPAWNFRNIYPALRIGGAPLGVYPLVTRTVTSGVPQRITLAGGTSTHVRFSVAAGRRALVTLSANGGPLPAPVRTAIVRLR